MAPADQLFTDKPLPQEGRSLGEIVECMVSREIWDYLTVMVGDRPGSQRQLMHFYITPKVLAHLGDRSLANATRACLPILDQWNSGVWIAKGRRGSPVEPLVEIPPPVIGYQLIIKSLARSTMIEPGGDSKLIYDLRFYSPATSTPEPPLLVKHDGPIEIADKPKRKPKQPVTPMGAPAQYDNPAIVTVARDVIERGIPDTQTLFFEKVRDECDKRHIRCHKSDSRFAEIVGPIYKAAKKAKKAKRHRRFR
jgi:hypothetical protein